MSGHRTFAWFWDFAVRHEPPEMRAMRRRVAGGARGATLELGVGVGTNWQYLPEDVEYAGIDVDPYMLRRASRYARERGLAVNVQRAAAEALPFADATFDTVIATLTLCSVGDLQAALREIRRVLKPGGTFRFWEHVRPEGRVKARLADVITPAWKRVGAGCHPNRRTIEAIEDAGFTVVALDRGRARRFVPFVFGVATTAMPPAR